MKSIKISHFIQCHTRDPEKGIELSQGIKRLFLKTTGQINRINATSDCQSIIQRTVPCLYIYLEEHKKWVERVCQDLEIEMVEPLWETLPEKVLEEFIDLGFKAIVVSAQASLFSKDIIGRQIDRAFLAELKRKEMCLCGENGEYHTFVIDGPIFKKGEIRINKSQVILKEGFWPHWFLDIQDYDRISK